MKQFLESSDFLQTIVEEAERNSAEARRLVAGLSEEQLNWTFTPDKVPEGTGSVFEIRARS